MSHCDRERLKKGIEHAVKLRRERHMMATGPATVPSTVGSMVGSSPAPVARPASMSNGNFRMESVRSESIPD
jgi:hypothetical protein